MDIKSKMVKRPNNTTKGPISDTKVREQMDKRRWRRGGRGRYEVRRQSCFKDFTFGLVQAKGESQGVIGTIRSQEYWEVRDRGHKERPGRRTVYLEGPRGTCM